MSKRAPDVAVLTANRLHDGIVVYLAADGHWVESIEAAAVVRSPEEARALQERGARDAAANLVVEPYLAEIAEAGGRPVPARMRERVRVEGPSILGDVPGYSPSPRWRGEGRREGQSHTPTSVIATAPHPSPLPASGERGSAVEAA